MAGSASCLHGNRLLIAYCISTLISSSRPSAHLTHSHAIYHDSFLYSALFSLWCHGLGLHVSFISPFRGWVVRVLKIMISSFSRFIFSIVLLLIIFEIWILDWPVGNSKNTWCALFFCGFRIFPLKNKYRRLEGSSCCRLLWLSQSLLSVLWAVGDQVLWRMGRWDSIFDGCFIFIFVFGL